MNEMAHRGYRMQPISLEKSQALNLSLKAIHLFRRSYQCLGLAKTLRNELLKLVTMAHFYQRRFKQKAGLSQKIIEYLDELGSLPNLPDKAQLSIFDM